MEYLTVEMVVELNRDQIAEYGGAFGILDWGKLDSAVQQVRQTFGGELLLKSLEDVAAGYWYYICQAHAFMDGNKRTAAYAVDVFLQLNGRELTLSSDEVERVTLGIATGTLNDRESVVPWIRTRLVFAADYGLD